MRSLTSVGVLLRADARRIGAAVKRPSLGVAAGLVLPLLLLAAGVRAVGGLGGLGLETTQDGVTLGVLVAGPIGFLAYGTLFRGDDAPFLRRLGLLPRVLYAERALRLLGCAVALVLLAVLAFTAAGVPAGRVLAVGASAASVSWGGALLAYALAARSLAARTGGASAGLLSAGIWDREVAAAAPLVYAPLLPLVAGGLAGGVAAGIAATAPGVPLVLVLVGVATGVGAALPYEAALPRFEPQALEMSFAPASGADGTELRARRGLARLLPRRAGAAWARDGAVASRRFAWASRLTWPVVGLSVVGLARWGNEPGTRRWVVAAALLVLAAQGVAAIGLGRLERRGPRWIDRGVGIPAAPRFLGRWAWGWGISLWLTVPLALTWTWWAAAGAGWFWIAVAGGTSATAAAASIVAAGWR